MKKYIILLINLLFVFTSCGNNTETTVSCPEGNITYMANFEATWSATTHPTDFPSNAHWSQLVGLTHNSDFTLWEEGSIASDGIEDMAETGGTDSLNTEVQAAITAGTGGSFILADSGISSSAGNSNLTFTVTSQHSMVSIVTMVAPSPDWFVGVSRVDLCDSGSWKASVSYDLYAFDSGTDSGTTYASANADVTPHDPISNINTEPIAYDGVVSKMGTMTFTKQ